MERLSNIGASFVGQSREGYGEQSFFTLLTYLEWPTPTDYNLFESETQIVELHLEPF